VYFVAEHNDADAPARNHVDLVVAGYGCQRESRSRKSGARWQKHIPTPRFLTGWPNIPTW
jgi:hypothetical protein